MLFLKGYVKRYLLCVIIVPYGTGGLVLLGKFRPKEYIISLSDVGPEFFTEKGIRGIILDLDNTIIPWRSDVLTADAVQLLIRLRDAGLKLCIVSNALSDRVNRLLKPLGIPGIARAVKPRRKAFKKALEILGTESSETAMVGDQIFTDILGGNRLGLYTVLVVPISKKEFMGTKFIRLVERRLLKRMIKKGIIKSPRRYKQYY